MRLVLICLLILVLLALAGYLFVRFPGLFPWTQQQTLPPLKPDSQPVPQTTPDTKARTEERTYEIRLSCPDALPTEDVVLVSDLEKTWKIRIDSALPTPPDGYFPTPQSVKGIWKEQSGKLDQVNDRSAEWTPPDKEGICTVELEQTVLYTPLKSESLLNRRLPNLLFRGKGSIRFLVPVHVSEIVDGKVNGFNVGKYPNIYDEKDLSEAAAPGRIRSHPETYLPPILWYRIDETTKDLVIAWNYRLGEFDLDPQYRPSPYPHYIALDPNILRKLNDLKTRMNADGILFDKFDILYGFRSPGYNLSEFEKDGDTSLKSEFSLHMYGKAADILVDVNRDLVMDDLNGDGKADIQDARFILRYVDELDRRYLLDSSPLVGGAGLYPHHDFWERGDVAQSPYIHVDVRGFVDEHGKLIRWVG
ncbi:MAG TPA: hypothetical protein PK395_01395, partial [bacterium]|nr:hypothetical protein [bacterium]